MPPDPRWLEILKASGLQTAAISAASALLIYGNSNKWFPVAFEPWKIQIAVVALVVCGCLSLASIGSASVKKSKLLTQKLKRMWAIRQAKRHVARLIAQLTATEKEILSYLLTRNQTMFTNTADCGHANTLVSKGIIVCALLPGQAYTDFEVPFKIPAHVWEVLMEHKADFPNEPQTTTQQSHPWRVHWMSR
jgi:hypothetical protein